MKWKILKRLADPDSIVMSVRAERAIVKVDFTINGAHIGGQFDPDNTGVYGIELLGSSLLTLLGLDEHGNEMAGAEVPEKPNEGHIA